MIKVVVLDKAQDFAALEEEWEDLYQNSPVATSFQSWAWLYSWWEFYGEGYELRLITVRDEDILVGIIPLMLERWGRFGRLLFIGTGVTDLLDVLVREGWEDEIPKVVVPALRKMNSWQVVDLRQLRPEAATWGVFRQWDGLQTCFWQDACLVVDVKKPWHEIVASLSKNHRSTVRRTLRRAEAEGVHCEVAGRDNVKQAAQRLIALNREAWEGRAIGPEHLTQRFESLIVTAAHRMTARGLGGISEFWRGAEVIVSDFWVSGQDFIGTYALGASQEALRRYQWSSLYIWDAINIARSRNSGHLNLLLGAEPYKLRWSDRMVPNYRLILGRGLVFWAPYAGYYALYSRARRYVHYEDSLEWVKGAVDKYRTLRHIVARWANKRKHL